MLQGQTSFFHHCSKSLHWLICYLLVYEPELHLLLQHQLVTAALAQTKQTKLVTPCRDSLVCLGLVQYVN